MNNGIYYNTTLQKTPTLVRYHPHTSSHCVNGNNKTIKGCGTHFAHIIWNEDSQVPHPVFN